MLHCCWCRFSELRSAAMSDTLAADAQRKLLPLEVSPATPTTANGFALRPMRVIGGSLGAMVLVCIFCGAGQRLQSTFGHTDGLDDGSASNMSEVVSLASMESTQAEHGHNLPSGGDEPHASTIPSTLPYECSSFLPTLPSLWDQGSCLRGAEQRLWNVAPNGSAIGGDAALCKPGAKLSCENRRTAWASPTVVIRPSLQQGPVSSVVVFLPGTGGNPQKYGRLLQAAAEAGHYVIGLTHLSQPVAVSQFNAWCDRHPPNSYTSALDCNKDGHETMLFGRSPTSVQKKGTGLWDVPADLSVESLLLAVLRKVEWGGIFLEGGDIAWSKVIMSGHSQGAGHAAYMSIMRNTRLVQFSGPQDCTACAAEWISKASATSHSVVRRSLFHIHEECGPSPQDAKSYCQPNLMLRNLQLMGLGDDPSIWEGTVLPQNLTNVMSVVTPACHTGRFFHDSVALDACAPVDAGITDLWRAMFSEMTG